MAKTLVLLDTNFLFIPFRFRIDIFSGISEAAGACEPVVCSAVLEELEGIAHGRGRHAREARLALAMLRRKKVRAIRSEGPADDWLFSYAVKNNAVVATNDAVLAKRLRKAGVRTIVLRAKSRIEAI